MDRTWLGLPVGVAVGAGTALAAPLPGPQARILGITLFCIALWIANPIPPWFTGLLGIGLIGLVFSPALALDGFAEPATWLIAFGLIIGEATRRSGLATALQSIALQRVADERIDARSTYRRLLIGLSLGGLAFAIVLPSALVRVLILAPILLEVGSAFDDRRARLGIFFAPLFATYYGAAGILTAGLPNIVIVGLFESVAGVSISWTEWLFAMFPIMGIGRAALIVAVVYAIYRPAPDATVEIPEASEAIAPETRRMAAFLLVGVAFWATDFLHGFHPVFGALLVAVLALLPRVGIMEFDAAGDVDFSIVFFVGAVFAVAAGLTETGFTDVAAEELLSLIPADASVTLTLAALFGVTLALVFLLEGVAVASVLTPILIPFAQSAGIPLTQVAYVEAIALSAYFFPYQSMVLVVMIRYDLVEPTEVIRMASILSIATILILLPLQLGYLTLL
ncbi:MAG: SLC13 family permease [Haloferacaceae archaeon]